MTPIKSPWAETRHAAPRPTPYDMQVSRLSSLVAGEASLVDLILETATEILEIPATSLPHFDATTTAQSGREGTVMSLCETGPPQAPGTVGAT